MTNVDMPWPGQERTSGIHRICMWIAAAVAIALSVGFYFHASAFPGCCDVRQYMEMTRYYESHGLSPYAPHADVRTYGYPLFLSVLARVTGGFDIALATAAFVVQLALYFACVVILYRQVSQRFGAAAASAVYFGLTLNVLLLPYLSLTMTDGFSVILLLAAAIVLLGLRADLRRRALAIRAAMLGALIGFAIVVRPANLWLCSLVLIGVLILRSRLGAGREIIPPARSWAGPILFVAVATVTGVIATAPQSAINWIRAGKVTPLPIYDLRVLQIDLGVRNLKYATSMVNGPQSVYYRNPLFTGDTGRMDTSWYLHEPVRGTGTLVLRMYAGFDFDSLFPYVYDPRPSYRPALFAMSQFVVFFGFAGLVLLAYPSLARRILGEAAAARFRWEAPVTVGQVYIPAIAAWAVIHGLSAIENRFALPMVTLLMPVAVGFVVALFAAFRSGAAVRGIGVMAIFAVWLAAAIPPALLLEQVRYVVTRGEPRS